LDYELKVNFVFKYFWRTFEPRNNFFVDTFQSVINEAGEEFSLETRLLEIELHSVFGWPRKLNSLKRMVRILVVYLKRMILGKRIILVWYSGEIAKPPKGYDLTLSYFPTSENNIYLPVWATYISSATSLKKYDREFIFNSEVMLKRRQKRTFENAGIACAFISNPSKPRFKFAMELERMGILDVYGAAVGKRILSKQEISKNYIFQLCLENEDSENYVTEKPFEAWMSGNIPIYKINGNKSILNTKSIVDISDYNPENLLIKLQSLMKDTNQLNDIYCEPILTSSFELQDLKRALVSVMKKRMKIQEK